MVQLNKDINICGNELRKHENDMEDYQENKFRYTKYGNYKEEDIEKMNLDYHKLCELDKILIYWKTK